MAPAALAGEPESVVSQAVALTDDPVVRQCRGELLATNYVLVLPRLGVRASDHQRDTALRLAALNQADLEFRGFVEELLDGLSPRPLDADLIQDLLDAWAVHQRSGSNLAGSMVATEVVMRLSRHVEISRLLTEQRPDIAKLFLAIPADVREVTRLNLYLPAVHAPKALSALLTGAREMAGLHVIERIEIAKNLGWPPPHSVPPFPTVIVYLEAQIDTPDEFDTLSDILQAAQDVADVFPRSESRHPSISEFALMIGPNLTVTQGYRLYKRYLASLGLLDAVYDPGWNHALAHNARSDTTVTSDWLRGVLSDSCASGSSGPW